MTLMTLQDNWTELISEYSKKVSQAKWDTFSF